MLDQRWLILYGDPTMKRNIAIGNFLNNNSRTAAAVPELRA